MLRNKRGITLIALVVTIIVLLVLSGAVISILVGENGLLNHAKSAKDTTSMSKEKEAIKLAYNDYQIQMRSGKEDAELVIDGAKTKKLINKWDVKFNDSGKRYTIEENGTISDVEPVVYDELPSDFWIIDSSGVVTINSEYLSPVSNVQFNYTGYIYGGETGAFTCDYTKLELPSEVNGKVVTRVDEKMPTVINVTNLKIDEGITIIGRQAFMRWIALNEVDLPNGLTYIGDGAFADCRQLKTIDIPSSVTSIEQHAFAYCSNLDGVEIPSSVRTTGSYLFSRCTNLTNVKIDVPYIQYGIFNYCENLTNVKFGDSVSSLGQSIFLDCLKLKNINIPSSVTNINYQFFYNLVNLENINVDENNTKFSSIDGVVFDKDKTKIIYYPRGKKNTTYKIPDRVTFIDRYSIYNNNYLENIYIPSSVTTIERDGITYNENLKNLYIDSGVTDIKNYALFHNNALKSVYIPSSATTIGHYIFSNSHNDFKVYTEVSSKLEGWGAGMLRKTTSSTSSDYPIYYGYTREAYESEIAGN